MEANPKAMSGRKGLYSPSLLQHGRCPFFNLKASVRLKISVQCVDCYLGEPSAVTHYPTASPLPINLHYYCCVLQQSLSTLASWGQNLEKIKNIYCLGAGSEYV